MVQDGDSTLDIIQRLSNERQQLYRLKWPRRQRQAYASRIRQLDKQISNLWHFYRTELATEPQLSYLRFVHVECDEFRSGVEALAAHHLDKAVDSPTPEVDKLATLADILREVCQELVQEKKRNLPLKAILAKRGETLAWSDRGQGRGYPVAIGSSGSYM